jgi:hypothetical protein
VSDKKIVQAEEDYLKNIYKYHSGLIDVFTSYNNIISELKKIKFSEAKYVTPIQMENENLINTNSKNKFHKSLIKKVNKHGASSKILNYNIYNNNIKTKNTGSFVINDIQVSKINSQYANIDSNQQVRNQGSSSISLDKNNLLKKSNENNGELDIILQDNMNYEGQANQKNSSSSNIKMSNNKENPNPNSNTFMFNLGNDINKDMIVREESEKSSPEKSIFKKRKNDSPSSLSQSMKSENDDEKKKRNSPNIIKSHVINNEKQDEKYRKNMYNNSKTLHPASNNNIIYKANDKLKYKNPFLSSFVKMSSIVDQDQDRENEEKYINEIRDLKNEIEAYKNYLATIGNKLKEEEKLRNEKEEIFKSQVERLNLINKNEIKNINEGFQTYKDFYEEELTVRKNVIEQLSITIDDLSTSERISSISIHPLNSIRRVCEYNKNSLVTQGNMINNLNQIEDKQNISSYNSTIPLNSCKNKNNTSNLSYSYTNNGNNFNSYRNEDKSCLSYKTLTEEYYNQLRTNQNPKEKGLFSMIYEEVGSATKKTDYIKLMFNNNKVEVEYKNGLNCNKKGKCPISRKFKYGLKGDDCDEILKESFANKIK